MPKYADDIWKRAIYGLIQSMVEFHLPDLYPNVDWSRECISRDKELPNLFDPKKEGQRFVDTVVQLFLLDGTEQHILLHVEVQGDGSGKKDIEDFEERMFEYYYRVRETFKTKNITALAILTDGNGNYRPDRYEHSFFGTEITYVFNVSKIIDYDDKELEENPNPFAMLMLAAKRALRLQRSDDETKKIFKTSTLRLAVERGYTSEVLKTLFYFVDWVVSFSETSYRDAFVKEVRAMKGKEGAEMPYVTSLEEVTREETMIATREEIALDMLRWGDSDEKILACAKISPEELAELKRRLRSEAE